MKLFHNKETGGATSLVRVEPGARYPPTAAEVSSRVGLSKAAARIGSITIHAGDYACAGTEHGVLVSNEGCVLLVMSSARDEILA